MDRAEKQEIKKEVSKDVASERPKKKNVKKSVRKVLNETKFREYLESMNPYYQTLIDPFNVTGIRIPDTVTYPSSTFSIVVRDQISVATAGVFCVGAGTMVGNAGTGVISVANGSLVPYPVGSGYFQYWISGGTATAASLGISATNRTLANWTNASSTVPTLMREARLVSGAVSVAFTGNYTQNNGRFIGAFAPPNSLRMLGGGLITPTLIQQLPGARVVPVNKMQGMTVLYSPIDNVSLQYVDTAGVQSTIPDQAKGGELWICGDGLTTGVTIEVYAIWNYEGIPLTNTFNLVQAETSINDPIQLAEATNMVSQSNNVVPEFQAEEIRSGGLSDGRNLYLNSHISTPGANQPVQSYSSPSSTMGPTAAPTVAPREQQRSGSMFTNILKDILPIVKEGAPIVKDLMSVFK